jgi:hypothetical protein
MEGSWRGSVSIEMEMRDQIFTTTYSKVVVAARKKAFEKALEAARVPSAKERPISTSGMIFVSSCLLWFQLVA